MAPTNLFEDTTPFLYQSQGWEVVHSSADVSSGTQLWLDRIYNAFPDFFTYTDFHEEGQTIPTVDFFKSPYTKGSCLFYYSVREINARGFVYEINQVGICRRVERGFDTNLQAEKKKFVGLMVEIMKAFCPDWANAVASANKWLETRPYPLYTPYPRFNKHHPDLPDFLKKYYKN